ncbi:HPr family phosphocarrier protein [Glaciihabitans sp. dw_435]|uniref:HPr family phosphocarrier protein n=1 Tax=Glaciihabitans sp. dw_435 TaxID=2720081 RepID=UPI001BD48748|nr:HPr family phosphocarrier protein [Glaciihabitans sp. dw_435]
MPSTTAVVGSASGMHARPASLFSQAAAATGVSVTIGKVGGKPVNAASILGLLTLGIDHGEEVTLTTEGDNAEEALATLTALLESNLDEA